MLGILQWQHQLQHLHLHLLQQQVLWGACCWPLLPEAEAFVQQLQHPARVLVLVLVVVSVLLLKAAQGPSAVLADWLLLLVPLRTLVVAC